ncbi:MAG TPA: hypothetical protein VFP59_14165 [Candidatus Angelobacter sp.]|nr:hypothetical protein [Candidatus Angelobacter sp.]
MVSARSVVLSFCASVAALAALSLGAQQAWPSSEALSTVDISFASNHNFQNSTFLNFGGETKTADAAVEPDGVSQFSLQSGMTTDLDRFAEPGISPALRAGFALRRARRGVDVIEF